MLAQKHLATAALPAHVVGIVNIADEVGFLEPDYVPVFICAHDCGCSARIATTAWAEGSPSAITQVVIPMSPALRTTQPSRSHAARESGVPGPAPAFFRHSSALHTRIAASLASS